jgi:Putative auto-transporter adhesin, head GIN domain
MKRILLLFVLTLSTTLVFSQKKDKVKGSKIVTMEQKDVGEFDMLEVADQLEVFLVKGEKCGIEIEADDNLHDAIGIDLTGTTLRLTLARKISSYKKFSIRVNYTEKFKLVTGRDDAKITALSDIVLDDITFKLSENCKFFGNVKSKVFTLEANDKSKSELNIKTEKTVLKMSKNSVIKGLISSQELNVDLYQKGEATLEGDANYMKIRLDNDSKLIAKKLVAKNIDLTAEDSSECQVNCTTQIIIDASGKSEIDLFGDQKIDMKRFADSAVLSKKPMK